MDSKYKVLWWSGATKEKEKTAFDMDIGPKG